MTVALLTGRYADFTPSHGTPVATSVGRPRFALRYLLIAEVEELKPRGLVTRGEEPRRRR